MLSLPIFPLNKPIAFQYLKKFRQPLIGWMSLFTKSTLHLFSDGNKVGLTVDQRPDKASQFIQMNMRDLWLMKEGLGDSIGKSSIFNIQEIRAGRTGTRSR